MVDSWRRELEKEHATPGHCLSFLTGSGKRRTLLDEDSTQSPNQNNNNNNKSLSGAMEAANRVAKEADELADTSAAAAAVEEEEDQRDPHPMAEQDMKQATMQLISKGNFKLGELDWDKAGDLIQYWTKQGTEESVHLSIILFDRMVEEHEKASKWSDSQMMFWLKAVIQNWNQGQRASKYTTFEPKDMIEQVEVWYNCIELDPEVYSMIIDGAAYSQPYLADSLLRRTVDSRRKGLIYSHTYNQVIKAWVDAGDPYQAEGLLDFMLNEYRNRREGGGAIAAKPNRQSFHLVLLGWASSNESVAAERTQQILEKMDMYSQTGALASVKPNASTYKWVMDCVIKSPNQTSELNAKRAQGILDILKAKANKGEEDFRPPTELYSVVVAAWGRAGNPDKAEDLLHDLYKDYCKRDHDKRLQPSLELFNNLLMGWSKVKTKAKRKKAGARAQAILEHMDKLASSKVLPGVKPDLQSYNILLDCWARCGDGARAQDLLENMIDKWESGENTVAPDTVSYSRVLTAWNRGGHRDRCEHIVDVLHKQFLQLGNYRIHPNLILCGLATFSSQPEALQKAMQLFHKMKALHAGGERVDLKPNTTSYKHLLECVHKADLSNCGNHAQSILNEMLGKYSAGDEDVKPDVETYNVVMKALVKTKQPKRTEEVLAQMYEEDVRGSRVYPNLDTFNLILTAWAKSGMGDEASKRSEQILRRLERIHESRILQNVKPDVVSYNTVLECLVQPPHSPDIGKRADQLLKRMEQAGVEPNSSTYNRVIIALKSSGDTKRANQLLRQLKKKTNQKKMSDEDSLMQTPSVQWF
ncbi:Pentatricopeptide repeat-containing protein [Seminavis robusta]|uniref:Pentatricopeptide repeat-containing protein n=1 Tax=Seminavis robusta TaxID=568900 RepID=A0A9N8HFY6_9STRA|nr:Pentatricopeptide repeat-containing protein [Seminavis robusta]|eukprot:Sro601_g173540.1 Pentatricopeptide repeat-containing protein (813) ;mRNA; r:28971-31491